MKPEFRYAIILDWSAAEQAFVAQIPEDRGRDADPRGQLDHRRQLPVCRSGTSARIRLGMRLWYVSLDIHCTHGARRQASRLVAR